MARKFLTPIDLSSLELQNFLVHNVTTLPTPISGRLVIHDAVLKFAYTANSTTKFTTVVDTDRFDTTLANYRTWSATTSYLSSNYYDKTTADNRFAPKSHTHSTAQISDWTSAWDARFNASSAVSTKFANYYTQEETDNLLKDNNLEHQRVFLNPKVTAMAASGETASSVAATGGTIYFNTTTGHILYYVNSKYYYGAFPDPEFNGASRAPKQGDIVAITSSDGSENKFYVSTGGNAFTVITDLKRIKSIETSIAACYTRSQADAKFRLITDSYTKTEVNTKLNSYVTSTALTTKLADYVLATTYNANKTSTDSKITALENWKAATAETIKILTDDANADGTINKWKELVAFLDSITDDSGTNLKGLLDKKAAIGPKSSTNGILTGVAFSPTVSGITTSAVSNAKYFSRLAPDSSGNLTHQQYKWVFEITVGNNTATALNITALTGLSTTSGTNTWPYLTVQVFKQSSSGVFDLVDIDIQLQSSKVVVTWGKAPASGEIYRFIITR